MIDKTSLKILKELCHDGRSTNTKLAKQLGISVKTVAKKIEYMISEGVIEIKAMPYAAKMGYKAQAFIGLYVDLKYMDSVCNKLMDNPHVNMIVTSFGRFNILLIVFFREWEMLQDFTKDELTRIKGITNIETYLISGEKQRDNDIFTDDLGTNKSTPIDDLDRKIIEALIRNGRPNHANLAMKLGISIPTLSRRIRFLLKEQVIKIVAFPDPIKLGYLGNAFIFIRADRAKVKAIYDRLSSYPEVYLVLRIMNDYDIIFGAYATDPYTLFEFLKSNISGINGILYTEIFIRGNFNYFSANPVFPPFLTDTSK